MSYNRYDVTYNVPSESGGLVQESLSIIAESMELAAEYITNVKEAEPASIVLAEEDTTVVSGGSTPTVFVESFNGRTGVVVPIDGDYTVAQITGAASETDLTTLEGRVSTTETDISTNTNNITTNAQGVADNASDITTNANAITALDTAKLSKSDPTVDAEVKTLKVNETTDTADVAGAGSIRYNSTDSTIEYSDGIDWKAPASGSGSSIGGLQFKPLTIGYAGDSISEQWSDESGFSGMFWYVNHFNPCLTKNIFVTSHGGSPSSALISEYSGTTAQIEVLEALADADVPELMIVHTTQNDYFGAMTNAEEESLNVTTYCDRALAKGVKNIIVFGHPPKVGTDEPSVLVYLNRILSSYAKSTDGVHFVDVLSLWREPPTTTDASAGGIAWKTGYSTDGTHPSAKAMYEAGKKLISIMEPLVQGKELQPTTANAYDDTNAPHNNLLDQNGLMLGSNGELNGVDNANVAGFSSGSRWQIEDGNGVTATPSIVVGDDGYNYQQIVLSGTATAQEDVKIKYSFAKNPVTLGTFIQECKLFLNDLSGVDFITWGTDTIYSDNIINNSQELSGDNEFHLTAEVEYSADSWSTNTFSITLRVLSGESPTGTIKLGRVGIYRQ